jgi:hypothetical protein
VNAAVKSSVRFHGGVLRHIEETVMKVSAYRVMAVVLMSTLCLLFMAGCRSHTTGTEENHAMSEKQKAIIRRHHEAD